MVKGGPGVSDDFFHVTVMQQAAIDALRPVPGGVYADATLGGGGHVRELLAQSAPDGRVIAMDQDERAIANAGRWLGAARDRVTIVRGNFRDLARHLDELGVPQVDGLVCDLGVSSPQLDEEDRGFTYRADAPLDMRMDQSQRRTAAEIVRDAPIAELTRIIREYGEERWAARIAAFIVSERTRAAIESTGRLVEVIKAAIPAAARRDGPHPAKRTFQALRIAVNDELGALGALLGDLPSVLVPGGRAAFITFHSLEDRLVKQAFLRAAKDCVCPPGLPQCVCGHRATLRVVTRKPILPPQDEVDANPRARSAKLRVVERL